MTGWVMLLLLFGMALVALRSLGLRGPLLQLAAAALLFGCAGYALQGRPSLAGSPRKAGAVKSPALPLTDIRHAFFGNFTPTEHWLLMSESFASRGNSQDAVNVLGSAVREHPDDAQLWIGLGNALVDHAGSLTPAAELAYRRSAELLPGHPAPAFFMGLALARSGDRGAAVALWREALAAGPADAAWRPLIEDAVAALERPQPVRR